MHNIQDLLDKYLISVLAGLVAAIIVIFKHKDDEEE